MRTSASADRSLGSTLFGKSRRAILALLYGRPDEEFYLREIAREAGTSPSSLQRDLSVLTEAGIIERSEHGRQVYFRANRSCPVFEELRGLVVKTFGVADVLKEALARHSSRIQIAFVYGSIARGEERAGSDVDVFVIGDVTFADISKSLRSAEARLGREINPTIYPGEELMAKARGRDHFVQSVLEGETNLSFNDWLAKGQIKPHKPSRREIANLLAVADRKSPRRTHSGAEHGRAISSRI